MVECSHYLSFTNSIFNLMVRYQILFLHYFQCQNLFIILLLTLKHPSKWSFSNRFKNLKVLETDELTIHDDLFLFILTLFDWDSFASIWAHLSTLLKFKAIECIIRSFEFFRVWTLLFFDTLSWLYFLSFFFFSYFFYFFLFFVYLLQL